MKGRDGKRWEVDMLNEELEKRKKNFKRDKKPTIDLI